MKRTILLLLIVLAFAGAYAQAPVAADPPQPAKSSLQWTNGTSHDFGKIPQNMPATYTFEFTNTGAQPITVTKAQPSCSCTVPDYTKEPVLPGKEGYVKATFNAHNPGAFNKTITVSTDGGDGNVILKISGEVLQKTDAAPKQ
jgi:hypothetical protein